MKTVLALSALLIASLGTQGILAADGQPSPSPNYAKDNAIFVAVKSKLKAEHVDGYSHLDVRTGSNGEVWLKGTLESQADADRAVELAKQAANVKAVHSELVVKPAN